MRILLFSDIHGNADALDAVLSSRHDHGPYDLVICGGDLVWAGPRPREVLARIRELCDDDPLGSSTGVCLLGNTDTFLLDDYQHRPPADKRHRRFMRHREWMLERLKPSDLTFLQALPFDYRVSPKPGHDLLAVHANPHNLEDPILDTMSDHEIDAVIGSARFQILAFGHIHIPFVRTWRGRLLVNVASVGLPRDGDPRAAYTVLTWTGDEWAVSQYRVEYDVNRVAEEMRTSDLPRGRHFAERLLAAQYPRT